MNVRRILIGASLLVVVALLYEDRRAARLQLDTLRKELAGLRAEQAAAAARASDSKIRAPVFLTLTSAPAQAEKEPVAEEVPSRARIDTAPRKDTGTPSPVEDFAPIHQGMEMAFAGERLDPSWARDARRLVDTALSAHLPDGSRLTAVECRSSLCRVETTHESRNDAKEFTSKSLSDPASRPWNGSFASGPTSVDALNGRVTQIVYLVREGHELPNLDSATDESL